MRICYLLISSHAPPEAEIMWKNLEPGRPPGMDLGCHHRIQGPAKIPSSSHEAELLVQISRSGSGKILEAYGLDHSQKAIYQMENYED